MKSAKLGEGWQRPDLEVGEGVVAERQGVQVTQPGHTIYCTLILPQSLIKRLDAGGGGS
jgi:hypothetical protein